ncbi:forkhead box protein N3 isoform X4 [Cricetulus griseus]|uniref:Forkhead box protein N3 n=1 Tax=Cricetulus griseus TaxID=10029 RepID=A0A9J7K9U8_CRIGR|nr:forkhead box protein N3 isoform X4 [Cricetulus griseus]XP_035311078.1 forkhead box protein N3 isoform X4 [Cricetulus griseus]
MGPVMPASKKPESSGISVSSGLSHCYPGSGFSKALQEDDDLDFPLPDIRLEEGTMEDEELTNLNWLHESKNLLKSFGESVLRSVSPVQDLDDDTPPSPAHSDMPYDARQNPNCKPPYSFSCLIFMAIEDSPTKRLPVKDIYNWILEHFPYFANAPTGWKNSVRHNLSLNKCFKKVDKERSQSIGKGSLWCIDPEYRQNLIQALKKTPYHPPPTPQAYQSTSGPPIWPGSTFFKRNGALLQGIASAVAGCGLRVSRRVAPQWSVVTPRRIITTVVPSPPMLEAPLPPATPSLPPPPPQLTTTTSLPPRGARRAVREASRAMRATVRPRRMTGNPARRRPRMPWGTADTHPSTRSDSTSPRQGRSPATHCPSKRDAQKNPLRATMRR